MATTDSQSGEAGLKVACLSPPACGVIQCADIACMLLQGYYALLAEKEWQSFSEVFIEGAWLASSIDRVFCRFLSYVPVRCDAY